MEWIHTITIIDTLGTFIFWQVFKLDSDIKQQSARTDRLYEMFVDLLKSKK